KGFLACIVGSLVIVSRTLGRYGRPDETTVYLFVGIIVMCLLVLSWVLNNNYKKSLQNHKRK
ncbi:MAG: hypothetical protein ACHQM6_04190, partial [Candidatus Kapaibacterium sp.]